MPTIKKIQEYVKAKHGFVPGSGWIADVKEQCGIYVRPSPRRMTPIQRQEPCPKNKINAIKDALNHFGMI